MESKNEALVIVIVIVLVAFDGDRNDGSSAAATIAVDDEMDTDADDCCWRFGLVTLLPPLALSSSKALQPFILFFEFGRVRICTVVSRTAGL